MHEILKWVLRDNWMRKSILQGLDFGTLECVNRHADNASRITLSCFQPKLMQILNWCTILYFYSYVDTSMADVFGEFYWQWWHQQVYTVSVVAWTSELKMWSLQTTHQYATQSDVEYRQEVDAWEKEKGRPKGASFTETTEKILVETTKSNNIWENPLTIQSFRFLKRRLLGRPLTK